MLHFSFSSAFQGTVHINPMGFGVALFHQCAVLITKVNFPSSAPFITTAVPTPPQCQVCEHLPKVVSVITGHCVHCEG